MITQLTDEQVALIPIVRDEWLARGLKTGRCDRQACNRAVKLAYAAAKLPAPKRIIWRDSPQAGLLTAFLLSAGKTMRDLKKMDPKVVAAGMQEHLSNTCFGQHDAGWLSFYAFMRRIGVPGTEPLEGLLRLGESGWWWPFDDVVVMSERPCQLSRDAQGRLHSETGKAIEYPDGWGFHVWHGVRVPEEVILRPETLSVQRILSEGNAEVRRVMVERVGVQRILTEGQAEIVDEDPGVRTLYRLNIGEPEPLVAVKVTCPSTGRVYFLRVPPNTTSCQAAVAWTFGMNSEEYRPVWES